MGSHDQTADLTRNPIPVIDFSPWNTTTSPEARLAVAKDLISAFQAVGFVYITNHGLSSELLDTAFATSKRLFSLPEAQKMQAPHPPGPDLHRGYSQPGREQIPPYMNGGQSTFDWKESYEVGSEENASQPNIWLPESTLPAFRSFTTEFYWECNKVAQSILRCIAMGLGLENPEFLTRFHSGHHNQLRLLHYPPVPAAEFEEGRMGRVSAHCDYDSFTLLFQDDCGGLEVEDPCQPGKFVPAPPVDGACVVNVGDLLMRWSNDVLKSTRHRVTLPPLSDRFEGSERLTRARYSIPYFVSADLDALVECLPVCTDGERPVKYAAVSVREYQKTMAEGLYTRD